MRSPAALDSSVRVDPAAILIAIVVFTVGYENGGYGLTARTFLAIGVWLVLVVGGSLGLLARDGVPRRAILAALLLASFALWTLVTSIWAPSAEDAFSEFDRTALYVGLFMLAIATGRSRGRATWIAGLALAIDAVVVVAILSRFFPSLFPERSLAAFLPNASSRLSFPLGYWNALAILAALGVPLTAAAVAHSRPRVARAAATCSMPAVASVIVLASSRGGAIALVIGCVAFLACSGSRAVALRFVLVGAVGAVLAVVALRSQSAIVDGPLGTPAAVHAGHVAAALLLAVLAVTFALSFALERYAPAAVAAPSPRVVRALAVVVVLVIAAAIVAAHPVRHFQDFQQPPAAGAAANFSTAHLTSGSGSGRWQFWSVAVHEWESAPVVGRGAGSYQSWWAEHAPFTYFLRNAHSLYLEVLGEVGLIGFVLLVGSIGVGLVTGIQAARRSTGVDRERIAALVGTGLAFFATAAIDWTWQLTVVALVGVVALGLLAASLPGAPPRVGASRIGIVIVGFVVAWAVLVAEAVPWLASSRISHSQSAARRGDLVAARKDALDAKTIEPWASSPYLQLALVEESAGDLRSAERRIHQALDRDTRDWATWYVAARIEREAGDAAGAAHAYARARSLNPRSPVFAAGSHAP